MTVNLGLSQGTHKTRAALPLTVMMLTLAGIFFFTCLNLLFTFFLCSLQMRESKARESEKYNNISINYQITKYHHWHLFKKIHHYF